MIFLNKVKINSRISMFDILLESAQLTAISNQIKNGKERCDYECGEKLINDQFREPKMNVCKANCDVIWNTNFIKMLQDHLSKNNQNPQEVMIVRKRLDSIRRQLLNSKKRLFRTKLTLKKVLYGRRADMSMRPVQNGPAYDTSRG